MEWRDGYHVVFVGRKPQRQKGIVFEGRGGRRVGDVIVPDKVEPSDFIAEEVGKFNLEAVGVDAPYSYDIRSKAA